jgi:hypothetical protein
VPRCFLMDSVEHIGAPADAETRGCSEISS